MKNWPWLVLSLVVVIIDQTSKFWAASVLLPYHPEPIVPMLNLTLAFNTGAAFSFLDTGSSWHRWVFASFSFVMSVVLFIWILRLPVKAKMQLFALSFILGGAIGNLIDRAFVGYVIDFIDVYYKNYHWPDFNIADSAICVGALLLFLGLQQAS